MSASDHFILLSAMTLAYAVFGMTGFGAAMVAVPILVHILPLQFALPFILLMDIVATVSVALKSRRHVVLAELRRLLPSLLVGVLLGATILSRIKSGWLLIALGVFVLAMSARSFFMRRAAAQPIGWEWSVPAGMAGGGFLEGAGGSRADRRGRVRPGRYGGRYFQCPVRHRRACLYDVSGAPIT